MNCSPKPFLEYFEKKIEKEELINQIGFQEDSFAKQLFDDLVETIYCHDSYMLEFLIIELFLWEENITSLSNNSFEYFTDLLNLLITCNWHQQHENIVMLLQKNDSESSVVYLCFAVYLKLPYLEWDENYSFQVKCVRAIGHIGGEKAISCLKQLCKIENSIIRDESHKQIDKLTK